MPAHYGSAPLDGSPCCTNCHSIGCIKRRVLFLKAAKTSKELKIKVEGRHSKAAKSPLSPASYLHFRLNAPFN